MEDIHNERTPLRNEDIPLYRELIAAYEGGEIEIRDENWLVFHLNEERQRLGLKYAIWISGREFLLWRELDKKNTEIMDQLIWGMEPDFRQKQITHLQ